MTKLIESFFRCLPACFLMIPVAQADLTPLIRTGETLVPGKGHTISSVQGVRATDAGLLFTVSAGSGNPLYLLSYEDQQLRLLHDPEPSGVASADKYTGGWLAWTRTVTGSPSDATLFVSSPEGGVTSLSARSALGFENLPGAGAGYQQPFIDREGRVAIVANDDVFPHFLLMIEGSTVHVLAQESVTPVPGRSDARFDAFAVANYAADGSVLLFRGRVAGETGYGLYLWHRATDSLQVVVDTSETLYPGTSSLISAIASTDPSYYFIAEDGSLYFQAYAREGGVTTQSGVLRYHEGSLSEVLPTPDAVWGRNFMATFNPVSQPSMATVVYVQPDGELIFWGSQKILRQDSPQAEWVAIAESTPRVFNISPNSLLTVDDSFAYFRITHFPENGPFIALDIRTYRVPVAGGPVELLHSETAAGNSVFAVFGDTAVFRSLDQSTFSIGSWGDVSKGVPLTPFSKFSESPALISLVSAPWGLFETLYFPFKFHFDRGWIYFTGTLASFYFYSYDDESWSWSSESVAPWIYTFGPDGGWQTF
jgi:hypothetical protein